MPKYRTLSLEELHSLEKEFVDFLVVNGIVADDWVKMKTTSPEKADKLIDLFSDVVMESVLRKIEFLELRATNHILSFQCLPDKIILVGVEGDGKTDFTDSLQIATALNGSLPGLHIFTSEKTYTKPREQELFEMLEKGHVISDGKLFKTLALSLADQ